MTPPSAEVWPGRGPEGLAGVKSRGLRPRFHTGSGPSLRLGQGKNKFNFLIYFKFFLNFSPSAKNDSAFGRETPPSAEGQVSAGP